MNTLNMIKTFEQFADKGIDYNSIIKRELPIVLKECNDYLKEFDLSVFLDENYDEFGLMDNNWVAVYGAGSVVDYDGEMQIGFNTKLLIDFCKEEECTEDETIDQIHISIWHEVGHGLVDWIRNETSNYYDMMEQDPESIPENVDKVMDEFYEKWEYILTENDDEEDIVEEFGVSKGGDMPARNHDLEDMIEDFKKYLNIEWK